MREHDNIENIFKEKLQHLEADPGANAWSNIQANINSGVASTSSSSVATVGSSSWVATAIVGIVISAVTIGGYYFFNQDGEKKKQDIQPIKNTPKTETLVETPSTNTTPSSTEYSTEKELPENQAEKSVVEKKSILENSSPEEITSVHETQIQTTNISEKESTTDSNPVSIPPTEELVSYDDMESIDSNAESDSNTEPAKNERSVSIESNENNNVIQPKVTQVITDSNTTVEPTSVSDVDENTEETKPKLVFPNIFTPNGDGIYDYYEINLQASDAVDFINVKILTKTGKEVFIFKEVTDKWNGNLQSGSLAPTGEYLAIGSFTKDGKEYPVKELFTLKR